MNYKEEAYNQIKIICQSLTDYNKEVALRGIIDRIEMTEMLLK